MNNVQHFYDVTAEQYAEEWYPNNLLLPTIRDFLSCFNKSKPKVLDLGCGPGQESMRLAKEGAEVIGIDFSRESIKIARERNNEIPFYEMDFFDIDISLGKFDGIFACSSLIHINENDLHKLLDRINSILYPGAYFMNVFIKGEGQRITYPEINGEKIERKVELYSTENVKDIFQCHDYAFYRDGFIDPSIIQFWHCIIFKKDKSA